MTLLTHISEKDFTFTEEMNLSPGREGAAELLNSQICSSVTESKIVGSGLGMPIVKRLVEFMDGKIEVKSRLGEGTTVTVMIPHQIADRSAMKKMQSHALEYANDLFNQKRIIMILF